jgi:hypothetical protein
VAVFHLRPRYGFSPSGKPCAIDWEVGQHLDALIVGVDILNPADELQHLRHDGLPTTDSQWLVAPCSILQLFVIAMSLVSLANFAETNVCATTWPSQVERLDVSLRACFR